MTSGATLLLPSLSGLSWVLNGYAIVYAATLVPLGRVADRFGPKRGFLIGLGLFTLASGACAASPGLLVLVLGRVLQALGAALLTRTSMGLLLLDAQRLRGSPVRRSGCRGLQCRRRGVSRGSDLTAETGAALRSASLRTVQCFGFVGRIGTNE
jgi:MFS family permease